MDKKRAAKNLQSYGRGGDSFLAHINPKEAALLKRSGGSGTRNPHTGLLEFLGGGGEGGGGDGWGGSFGGDGEGDGGGGFSSWGGEGRSTGNLGGWGNDASADSADSQSAMNAFSQDALSSNSYANDTWGQDSNNSVSTDFGDTVGYYANDAINTVNNFTQQNPALSKIALSLLSKMNPAIGLGLTAYSAATNPGGFAANAYGSAVGNGLGLGPVGGMVGSIGMNAAMNAGGSPSAGPSSNTGEVGGKESVNPNDIYSTLFGMYNSNRASNAFGNQINSLQSLYGPNSPYAQQLAQTLARQDAKSGRRSQVGARQVELQARLAGLTSRNAPQLQSLTKDQLAAKMSGARDIAAFFQRGGAGELKNMYNTGSDYLKNAYNSGSSYLGNMFGGEQTPDYYNMYNLD